MVLNIKPIETIYNGYRFRSRLEARWAVFFDALGVEYDYEPEGFDLGDLGFYLPDFYLPENKWFVEVKGNYKDVNGLKKARHLDNYPSEGDMGCLIFRDLEYAYSRILSDGSRDFNGGFLKHIMINPLKTNKTLRDYNNAITKARQARFEHGESP